MAMARLRSAAVVRLQPTLADRDKRRWLGTAAAEAGVARWEPMVAREYYDYRRAIYDDITHKAILVDTAGTLLAPTEPMAQAEEARIAQEIQKKREKDGRDTEPEKHKTMAKPELNPSLLTLALNDAITYDKATKSGGPNGSIRLSAEISRPKNSGLSAALDLLGDAKKEIDSYSKGGPIAFADLIQFAALKKSFLNAAIAKCGGNEEKGRTLYTTYGSNGQWGLFDKLFGREDAQEPDPEGRVPQWSKASVQEMKDKFTAIGLGPRQLVVMSAFLGPDQLATGERSIADPDCRPWVEKYQRSRETVSRTDYKVDLITTLTKLNSLGQKINYEAYTYPKQKINLGKLKL